VDNPRTCRGLSWASLPHDPHSNRAPLADPEPSGRACLAHRDLEPAAASHEGAGAARGDVRVGAYPGKGRAAHDDLDRPGPFARALREARGEVAEAVDVQDRGFPLAGPEPPRLRRLQADRVLVLRPDLPQGHALRQVPRDGAEHVAAME